jgi:hypothetical protein
MEEELGTCTYCMRTGRKKNLTPLIEISKPDFKRQYCPRCKIIVEKEMEPHTRKLFEWGSKGK